MQITINNPTAEARLERLRLMTGHATNVALVVSLVDKELAARAAAELAEPARTQGGTDAPLGQHVDVQA